MSLDSRKITPLPPEVVAKLKSSTSITHLNGVIAELVKNALDANANTVSVTVDFRRGGCRVDDNGDGILPTEFEPSGGLGKAHHTSKYHTSNDVYGRKGLFLASLSSLSLLTITSHHARHSSTNTIMFHHSTPVARLTPAPVQQELKLSNHGTSVTVNDLFGNMPVRVKNRALALQKHDELDRQWDELRQLLVSLMLANENLLKLIVTDAAKDRKLTVRSHSQIHRTGDKLDLQRIGSILAQTGLITSQINGNWNAMSASVPGFSVRAAISLVPSPTKKVQFISVGMDPVFPRSSVSFLYTEVNRLFSLSDFGTTRTPSMPTFGTGPAEHPNRNDSPNAKPTTKPVNKWPMFYIRIDTNEPRIINNEDHELPESDKSVQRIIDVLAAMIQEFLKQHDLRPRLVKRSRKTTRKVAIGGAGNRFDRPPSHSEKYSNIEETLSSQLKLPNFQKSTPNVRQSFGEWSRIKSFQESFNASSTKAEIRTTYPEITQGAKQPSAQGGLSIGSEQAKHRMLEESQPLLSDKNSRALETTGKTGDSMVPWIDPYTGQSYLTNSQTGHSIDVRSPTDAVRRPKSTKSLQTMRTLDSTAGPRSGKTKNLVDTWESPVFSRSEKPLNVIAGCGTGVNTFHAGVNNCSFGVCGFENLGLSNVRGKLRKQDLETAEIIAQVDHKFILAKMKSTAVNGLSSDPGSILVLVDQHAADERCRVERLYDECFTSSVESSRQVRSVSLEPIIFEIPATEAPIFGRYTEYFESWGVDYTIEQGPADGPAHILVHTLPALIAERCRLEPDLVTNLIRGEIWKREENGRGPENRTSFFGLDSTDRRWIEQLDICPQGTVELLNSRACRSAIMFNDELTIEECQSLVSQLARCVFPFQCAHGRPSITPILDMTNWLAWVEPEAEYMNEAGEPSEFAEAFRTWRDNFAHR
ncbi:hypothetical protein BDV23DRAFT_154868 [Aspergillus alliaceus]|uniref:MutL C-terminal dimerisation domain-containing protein n=1 Tax=Petromyces alliaceus TaxID=209559 RepID=A0A5N7C9T2_PETAA|nr:hypothetical protein BDV23DRAFT_154868 [Aspergillus alliaceus]